MTRSQMNEMKEWIYLLVTGLFIVIGIILILIGAKNTINSLPDGIMLIISGLFSLFLATSFHVKLDFKNGKIEARRR